MKTILSLCDYTGAWPAPYRGAGYTVIQIDIKHGQDVIELARNAAALPAIHGVLAAPPCTDFAASGARWWPAKDARGDTAHSLAIVDACLSIIEHVQPVWWALEQPVGRLPRLRPVLGRAAFSFQPCDFGDPYTKRTMLYGRFTAPTPDIVGAGWSVYPAEGSKMHRLPPSPDRQMLRSITPAGFARAYFIANP